MNETISIVLPEELRKQILETAQANERTLSTEIRYTLRRIYLHGRTPEELS